jgi:thymidylate kinase
MNLPVITDTYMRGWLAAAAATANGSVDRGSLVQIYRCLPVPDLALQLDCPVEVAFDRILARPKGDHILRSGGKPRLQALAVAYGDGLDDHVGYQALHLDGQLDVDSLAATALGAVVEWTRRNDPLLHGRIAQ